MVQNKRTVTGSCTVLLGTAGLYAMDGGANTHTSEVCSTVSNAAVAAFDPLKAVEIDGVVLKKAQTGASTPVTGRVVLSDSAGHGGGSEPSDVCSSQQSQSE